MLQDCPATAVGSRKVCILGQHVATRIVTFSQDIMMVFRHMVTVPQRRVLLSQINKLLDERVILGSSLSAQETVR